MIRDKFESIPLILSGLIALVFCSSIGAAYVPTTFTGSIGRTENQQRFGDSLLRVCAGFIVQGFNEQDPESGFSLFRGCGVIVRNARRLEGIEVDSSIPTDNELTVPALVTAVQNISPEEVLSVGSIATQSQSLQYSDISGRLNWILFESNGLLPDHERSFSVNDISRFDSYIYTGASSLRELPTEFENEFDSNGSRIVIGSDYRFGNTFWLGGALGYSNDSVKFKANDFVVGGGIDAEQFNISAYGLWVSKKYYISTILNSGRSEFDYRREMLFPTVGDINDLVLQFSRDTTKAEIQGSESSFSLGVGRNIRFLKQANLHLYSNITYSALNIDSFDELGSSENPYKFRFDPQTIDSTSSRVGYRIDGTLLSNNVQFHPHIGIEWIHEFEAEETFVISSLIDDPRINSFALATDKPDEDYYKFSIGLSATLNRRHRIFTSVDSLLDFDDRKQTVLTIGVNFSL